MISSVGPSAVGFIPRLLHRLRLFEAVAATQIEEEEGEDVLEMHRDIFVTGAEWCLILHPKEVICQVSEVLRRDARE